MYTDAQLAAALKQYSGNITKAAKNLGCARSTVHRRVADSAELTQLVTDSREALVDLAEDKLRTLINKGNPAAVFFTLKTLGKPRGYIERQEITGKDGAPVMEGLIVNIGGSGDSV